VTVVAAANIHCIEQLPNRTSAGYRGARHLCAGFHVAQSDLCADTSRRSWRSVQCALHWLGTNKRKFCRDMHWHSGQTLKDCCSTVRAWAAREHGIGAAGMVATTTGKRADIAEATDSIRTRVACAALLDENASPGCF
jgi:hypothetical protein